MIFPWTIQPPLPTPFFHPEPRGPPAATCSKLGLWGKLQGQKLQNSAAQLSCGFSPEEEAEAVVHVPLLLRNGSSHGLELPRGPPCLGRLPASQPGLCSSKQQPWGSPSPGLRPWQRPLDRGRWPAGPSRRPGWGPQEAPAAAPPSAQQSRPVGCSWTPSPRPGPAMGSAPGCSEARIQLRLGGAPPKPLDGRPGPSEICSEALIPLLSSPRTACPGPVCSVPASSLEAPWRSDPGGAHRSLPPTGTWAENGAGSLGGDLHCSRRV